MVSMTADRPIGQWNDAHLLRKDVECNLTSEAICRCAEHGQLHLIVAVSGLSFICLNSLLDTPKQVVEV